MVASFSRKKTILQEAKFPKDFIVPQYEPAQKAIARYLAHGEGNREQLAKDIESMLTGSPNTRWFRMREQLCRQAVSCLLAIESALRLEDLDVALGNNVRHRMVIGGVVVSLYPDLIVRGANRKGPFVGAVKLRYGKTKAITEEWGAFSATILHQFAERHLAGTEVHAERRHCRIVDVFAGKVSEAPESFKARRKDLEAACWNIKSIWDTVTPAK
jgi:hypothetical protein